MVRNHLLAVTVSLSPSVAIAQGAAICHAFSTDLERLACYDQHTQYVAPEATPSSTVTEVLPIVSEWVVEQEVSALDGRVDVWMYVESSNLQPNRINRDEHAQLWVQCVHDTTNLVVAFNDYISERQNVRYRIDSQESAAIRMVPSQTRDALGLWRGAQSIPFVRQLFGASEIVVAFQSHGNSRLEFSFNISGLRENISALADACGWQP